MLLFSIIKLWFIFICWQGGAASKGAKGKHTILATNDKLYLAKLPISNRENHWRLNDYQGEMPEDDKTKNKDEKDIESKEKTDDENKSDKKKAVKKQADKKKTPFEITGGREALPHEFPWTARLELQCQPQSNEFFTCGGSLISPRVILSAYHCSCNWISQGQHVDYMALNSFAKLGAHNLNYQTYIKKKIIDVKFPPNPAPYSPSLELPPNKHDLVMFILKEPVKFSLKISPICLPSQGQDFSGKNAIAAGWGDTGFGETSLVLKKVQLNVGRSIFNKIQTGSMRGPGHATCSGDSGGPLMYEGTTSYTLIGTLSTGSIHCGLTGQSLFNKVSDWVNWIKKELDQLGEKTDGKSCKNNREEGFGNQDDGGRDDSFDNHDQNGGDSEGNQDHDKGDGPGNQDQFGDIWPFGPIQDPFSPF